MEIQSILNYHSYLLKSDFKYITDIKEKADEDFLNSYEKKNFYCKNCKKLITSFEERLSIHGSYTHTFKNPTGIIYEIACFKNAFGCSHYGTPTADYSWFHGYRWSFAICTNCLVHLGWRYESSSDSFWGLILDNLTEDV